MYQDYLEWLEETGRSNELIKAAKKKSCEEGFEWDPRKKECVKCPGSGIRSGGAGRGLGRGRGRGPIGIPIGRK